MIPIPMLYKASDFLLDQKSELDRFDDLRRKARTESQKAEIREQQEYLYNQGLRAINRFDREIPSSVKSYYLGNAERPSMEKVSEELREITVDYGKINYRIAYIIVAVVLSSLFVSAILFLWQQ